MIEQTCLFYCTVTVDMGENTRGGETQVNDCFSLHVLFSECYIQCLSFPCPSESHCGNNCNISVCAYIM